MNFVNAVGSVLHQSALGCMQLLCQLSSSRRGLLLPAGAHRPSCQEPEQAARHPVPGPAPATTHSIRAPPHSALPLCTSYSCTQTYLHLTYAMLCTRKVSAHFAYALMTFLHQNAMYPRQALGLVQHCACIYAQPEISLTAHAHPCS